AQLRRGLRQDPHGMARELRARLAVAAREVRRPLSADVEVLSAHVREFVPRAREPAVADRVLAGRQTRRLRIDPLKARDGAGTQTSREWIMESRRHSAHSRVSTGLSLSPEERRPVRHDTAGPGPGDRRYLPWYTAIPFVAAHVAVL